MRVTQGRRAAIEQFKRAVEIDDGFAVAHARLGTEYSTGGESVLGIQHTTRAFELRERATDDEKFFITATYHRQVTGNLELALQAFDLWAQTYPRTFNYYGLASGFVIKGQGRYEGCIERAAKAEAADPAVAVRLSQCRGLLHVSRSARRSCGGAPASCGPEGHRGPISTDWHFHLAFLRGDDAAMEREFARARGNELEPELTHFKALAARPIGPAGARRLAGAARGRSVREGPPALSVRRCFKRRRPCGTRSSATSQRLVGPPPWPWICRQAATCPTPPHSRWR